MFGEVFLGGDLACRVGGDLASGAGEDLACGVGGTGGLVLERSVGGIEVSFSFVMLVFAEESVAVCMLVGRERSVAGIEGSFSIVMLVLGEGSVVFCMLGGRLGEFGESVELTMLGEVCGSMLVAMQFTQVLVVFDL